MKLQNSKPLLRDDRSIQAFTMIEVAMSLAIVAFAMVAIMGVMPTGLNVQRQNSEETIISQDGTYLLEALRQGVMSTNLAILSSSLTRVEVNSEFDPIGNPVRYGWTNNVGPGAETKIGSVDPANDPSPSIADHEQWHCQIVLHEFRAASLFRVQWEHDRVLGFRQ